jgi:hypothetical protein
MSIGDRTVTWLPPLFTNAGGADVVVGVTSDSAWLLQLDSPIRIASETRHPAILPLVQPGYGGDYATVHALISDRLDAVGLPSSVADTFPFMFPIRTAFDSSAFWAAHAAAWLPHVNFDESFAIVLLRFTLDNQIPQADRHLVARHVHQWEVDRGVSLVRPSS